MTTTFSQAVRDFERCVRENERLADSEQTIPDKYKVSLANYLQAKNALHFVHERQNRHYMSKLQQLNSAFGYAPPAADVGERK